MYLFYYQIEEKSNKYKQINERYYILNHKSLEEIRIYSNYKFIKEDIKNNKIDLNNLCIDNNNIKNLYSLIKKCPIDLLQKYSNKIIKIKIGTFEPEIILKKYYIYKENANNVFMIYNNFEIIDKKIIIHRTFI